MTLYVRFIVVAPVGKSACDIQWQHRSDYQYWSESDISKQQASISFHWNSYPEDLSSVLPCLSSLLTMSHGTFVVLGVRSCQKKKSFISLSFFRWPAWVLIVDNFVFHVVTYLCLMHIPLVCIKQLVESLILVSFHVTIAIIRSWIWSVLWLGENRLHAASKKAVVFHVF